MLHQRLRPAVLACLLGLAGLSACTTAPNQSAPSAQSTQAAGDPRLSKVGQIVVVYMENRSFDHLFGLFPGADGIANAIAQNRTTQTGPDGKPYAVLPPIALDKGGLDKRFTQPIPNTAFRLEPTVSLMDKTASPVHAFWTHERQINGGKNDRFVVEGNTGALPLGYFDGSKLKLWSLAQRFTLADRFFQSAYGGSFLNHMWLVCACTPVFPNAPHEIVDRDGRGTGHHPGEEAAVTQDGYAVNTLQGPWLYDPTKKQALLPAQTAPTIGDRLTEKGVAWTYYADGFDDAVKATAEGRKAPNFSYHHQPFTYFKRFIDSPAERAAHLKDRKNLIADIAAGKLPPVSFYKPTGGKNMHPGMDRSSVAAGDDDATQVIEAIMAGPQWKDTVVIVTTDENGGFWDHVAPPKGDRFGPATRIPALVISPFSEGGSIDHTEYETVSILKFIEERFGLQPLGKRDAAANSLAKALKF
jgi:phospholipase C